MKRSDPLEKTKHWLANIVIGLGLCPFAARVYQEKQLTLKLIEFSSILNLLDTIESEAKLILNDNAQQTTSLVVIKPGLEDFNDYLDIYVMLEALIHEKFEDQIQLASFHPDYIFDGSTENDITNYTNRSPYPTIHLLRSEDVSLAIDTYPDVSQIPENNKEKLRQLGLTSYMNKMA